MFFGEEKAIFSAVIFVGQGFRRFRIGGLQWLKFDCCTLMPAGLAEKAETRGGHDFL